MALELPIHRKSLAAIALPRCTDYEDPIYDKVARHFGQYTACVSNSAYREY